MNSTTQTIYVKGALTPSQRDTILAATKWIERICDRKEMLPASFMDNTDPAPIAKKLRAILDSQNVQEHATLSAGASVERGVEVQTTEDHENRAADRGCCVSTC